MMTEIVLLQFASSFLKSIILHALLCLMMLIFIDLEVIKVTFHGLNALLRLTVLNSSFEFLLEQLFLLVSLRLLPTSKHFITIN